MVGRLTLSDLYAQTPPSVDLVIERRGDEIRIRARRLGGDVCG